MLHLQANLSHLGLGCCQHGVNLDPNFGMLGACWGYVGTFWVHVGHFSAMLEHFGAMLSLLEPMLGPFGSMLVHFGAMLAHLMVIGRTFCVMLEPSWCQEGSDGQHLKKPLVFLGF